MGVSQKLCAARRAAGLCFLCGALPPAGTKTCEDCRGKQAERTARLRESGRCYCGRRSATGYRRCEECRARDKTDQAKRRVSNRAAGLCGCGEPRAVGKLICVRCSTHNRQREQRHLASGLCRCGRDHPQAGKRTCTLCVETKAAILKRLRDVVFTGYGGRCVCCGDSDVNVLQLDHVNNDGGAHRKEIGTRVYRWCVENSFPPRLQLLCGSCHLAKTRTGDCSYRRKTA